MGSRRLRDLGCSAAGAAVGLGLTLALIAPPHSTFLLASLGGTAVFLFGLTDAPAAQPRALFGGHIGAALIGVTLFELFGAGLAVEVAAVTLTLVYMLGLRMTHPPAGANALIVVAGHVHPLDLVRPVGLGVVTLFIVVVLWSRLRPGVRYPVAWWAPSPPPPDVAASS